MPTLGEIRKNRQRMAFIWAACADCGKERWVKREGNVPRSVRCNRCANSHFICAVCGVSYRDQRSYTAHWSTAHPGYAFERQSQKSRTGSTRTAYRCLQCGKLRTSLRGIVEHYKAVHKDIVGSPSQGDNAVHPPSSQDGLSATGEEILKAIGAMIAERESLIERVAAAERSNEEIAALRGKVASLEQHIQKTEAELQKTEAELQKTAKALEECSRKNALLIQERNEPFRFKLHLEQHNQTKER